MRLVNDVARVRVPATSANLGPGFDAFGLAVDIWDEVEVRAIAGPTQVQVTGEGAGTLPDDESHLIVKALRVALDYVNAPQAGFALTCTNRIPHGRGLGSSAAATIAGLMLARGLLSDPGALDDASILSLATEFEGHPDNAAPALHGGATIAYMEDGEAQVAHIPSADVGLTLLVPDAELATSRSRGALPPQVPHADAAFNAARSGLLTLALGGQKDLLFAATQDRLHQNYRAGVMPQTATLLDALRARGAASVVSGAGPSILVLGEFPADLHEVVPEGWALLRSEIPSRGAHLA